MKQFAHYFLLALVKLLLLNTAFAQVSCIAQSSWTFREQNTNTWHKAQLPANIYSDLFRNSLIPDPFYGNNEKQLQWIEKKTWEYRCLFSAKPASIKNKNIQLKLEEPNGDAIIFLNGVKIAETHNAFRTYTLDIGRLLKEKNELLIVFTPVSVRAEKEALLYPFEWPEQQRIFTRKPQYEYGWDWGPRFIACGLKGMQITEKPAITFDKPLLEQEHLSNGSVLLKAKFIIKSEADTSLNLEWYDESAKLRQQLSKQFIHLKKGINTFYMQHLLMHPRLWWCNGMGEQELYLFTFQLSNKRQEKVFAQKMRCGIRKIEWVQDADSIGKTFYLKLNNKPVFMKGANFIPPHSFLSTCNDSAYRAWINMAAATHMNMLRVWGGGSYYPESFYNAADETGILIWQDFMFACAMYPAHESFLQETEAEVRQWVKTLRHHPSLAIWCGNNETDEAWKNWGWQKQYHYSYSDSTQIANADSVLFHALIPGIVTQEDPQAFYWPSSPSVGWGRAESLTRGDAHYWGVWWGMQPFEIYKKKTGRFMTEYGFQGMPSLKTFQTFMPSASFPLDSLAYMNHQKHPTGYQTIQTYMLRDYKIPANFEGYAYVSQLLQAEGMRMGMESHRAAMPYCMGTLFWQLNDCWPVSSWSFADYQGRPKALYYQTEKSFSPVLLYASIDSMRCRIALVTDRTNHFNTTVFAQFLDENGKSVQSNSYSVQTDKPGSYTLAENILLPATAQTLRLYCTENNDTLESFYHLLKPKDLKITPANIQIKILKGDTIAVSSSQMVQHFWLEHASADINFQQNNITLLPGKTYYFYARNQHKAIQLTDIKYIYYRHENTQWQSAE